MVAKWVREAFDLDINWHAYDVGEFYETFEVLLMGLEADSIDSAVAIGKKLKELELWSKRETA